MSIVADLSSAPVLDTPPRRRRRIPLSLKLFLAMLVSSATVSTLWVGILIYREHVAIRQIRQAIRESNRQDHNSTGYDLRGPEWWQDFVRRGWVGHRPMDLFYYMGYLELDHVEVSDATLCQVSYLSQLTWLSLNDAQLSDAGLAKLTGLTKLLVLRLDNTPITDVGLAHLKGMNSLVRLSLRGTQVTDAGIADLQRALPGLEIIRGVPRDEEVNE